MLAAASLCIIPPNSASAVTLPFDCSPQYENLDGRCINQTYFSGEAWENHNGAVGVWSDVGPTFNYVDSLGSDGTNQWVIPSNIDNGVPNVLNNFINFMNSYLNPSNPLHCTFPQPSAAFTSNDSCASYRSKVLGAAFIILTMIGGKYTTYNVGTVFGNSVQTGVNDARAEFNTWSQEVQQASAAGSIDWNELETFPNNHPNSGARNFDHDVGMFLQGSEVNRHSIVFHNPSGDYIINRRCGNSVGFFQLAPVTPSTASCNGVVVDPPKPDPYSPMTIKANVTISPSGDAGTAKSSGDKLKITVSGPSSYNSGYLTPTVAGNDLTVTTPSFNLGTGTYTVTYNVYDSSNNPLISPACSTPLEVTNMPYLSVTGGDVETGAGMTVGGTCTTEDPKAGVVSWNQENASYDGAGTQYAAYALNYLQDFATAQSTVGLRPNGLSLANTVNVNAPGTGSDTYGGGFGSEPCIPDYYNPPSSPTATGNTTINTLPASGTHTQYISSGNVIINLPGMVPNGSHNTIYVDGNVYIASNIEFSGNYPSGTADIPAYDIIATGNIYIDPGVTEIDGIFAAEPDSSGNNGIIYTCASSNGYSFTGAALDRNLYNTCNTQLKVNGSLIAHQIRLLRASGSLYGNTAAESVNFDPEVWLGGLGSNIPSETYDAITGLPPAL